MMGCVHIEETSSDWYINDSIINHVVMFTRELSITNHTKTIFGDLLRFPPPQLLMAMDGPLSLPWIRFNLEGGAFICWGPWGGALDQVT